MKNKNIRSLLLVFALIFLGTNIAMALGFQLSQSKEELKLKYKLNVRDIGTGGYAVDLTINDHGRLNPIYAVDLYIPRKEGKEPDGSTRPDLSLSLATKKEGKKQSVHFQLRKEWAERAEIHLKTTGLDGKVELMTWYYHTISIKDAIAALKGEIEIGNSLKI